MDLKESNIALKIKPSSDNSEVEFYRAGAVIGGAKIVPPANGLYSLDVFGFSRLDPQELKWSCGRYSDTSDCVVRFGIPKDEKKTRSYDFRNSDLSILLHVTQTYTASEELLVNIRLREDLGDVVFKELGETQVGIQVNSRTNPKIVGDLWSKLVWNPPDRSSADGSLPYPDLGLETRDMIQICGFAGISQPVVYQVGERRTKDYRAELAVEAHTQKSIDILKSNLKISRYSFDELFHHLSIFGKDFDKALASLLWLNSDNYRPVRNLIDKAKSQEESLAEKQNKPQ